MNKQTLIREISTKLNMNQNTVATIIDAATNSIVSAIKDGKTVNLGRQFGTFKPKLVKGRKGTVVGTKYKSKDRNTITFQKSDYLKDLSKV